MKKLLLLIVGAFLVNVYMSNTEYIEIPSSSIRMRVIANSNSKQDQKDKIQVKSALEDVIYNIIKNTKSSNDADKEINANLDLINKEIDDVINRNNINTSFSAKYGYNYFPEKEFKGVMYPSGNYKSLVVTLGEGEGDNWWCVLYPPLCLIDDKTSEYEYHSIIKDTLTKYN